MINNSEDFVFKIILLGDPGVGKTSLLYRFMKNKFSDDYKSTIGVDFMTKIIKYNEYNVKIILWDVAGQGKFASFRNFYFSGSNFVVFVFDLTNKESFSNLSSWIDDYKKQMKYIRFCVVGNKLDLKDHRSVFKDTYNNILIKYKDELSFLMETSAKTGKNVEKAFQIIIKELINYSDKLIY